MSFSTYSALQTTIASYLGRTDLTAMIPTFITLAEARLQRELRTRPMLKSATANMTGGDNTIGLPTDFLEMRDLFTQGNPRMPVSYMSPSAFTRNARATESGRPVDYSVIGSEMNFAPIPDGNYVLEMLYYAKPEALSDTTTSNVFLANYPDLLLYGSLAQAEPYLMNDARLATWASLYANTLELIATSDDSSEYNGVPLQMKLTSR
jgi:hypothetical protein